MTQPRHGGRLPDLGMEPRERPRTSALMIEHPESVRIEIRMSDHTRVIELLPGDSGWPPLKADLDMNREVIEVPPEDHLLPWRVREPGPNMDITLKVTCGKATYSREERSEADRG